MNVYSISVRRSDRSRSYDEFYAANNLEQAVVAALRAAQAAGIRSDHIREIKILDRLRMKEEA